MEVIGYFILAGILPTFVIGGLWFARWMFGNRNAFAWAALAVFFVQLNVAMAQYVSFGAGVFEEWWFNLLPVVLSALMVVEMGTGQKKLGAHERNAE
jgi:peptidoglycan/LPS O-acetylase OafA/YrhL